ncbi:MAG: peptidase C39 [Lachnospiraceae bacterium]|nr:peptidase C39 [Lachnospiraceae bacterium]
MLNPLRYQISDYDCGPTSLLNAMAVLFPREDIPPEMIRNIMLYCLDSYGFDGVSGKSGTSKAAMMFLTNWMNSYAGTGQLSLQADYLSGSNVYFGQSSYLNDTLHRGGVVVVRCFYDEWHYILLTGEENRRVYFFDPYYHREPFEDQELTWDPDPKKVYNTSAPTERFNQESLELYHFGPIEEREAVLLFNQKTVLTPEKTIEYFI